MLSYGQTDAWEQAVLFTTDQIQRKETHEEIKLQESELTFSMLINGFLLHSASEKNK